MNNWQEIFNTALIEYKKDSNPQDKKRLSTILSIDINKSLYENFKDNADLAGGFNGYLIKVLQENGKKPNNFRITILLKESYMNNTLIDFNKLNSYVE